MKFARAPVKGRRNCSPRRHEDLVLGGQQIPLGGDTALGERPPMGLAHVNRARRVIEPDRFSRLRIESIETHPIRWPNPCRKIENIVIHHDASPGRPSRNESSVSEDHFVTRSATLLPMERSIVGIEAIEETVVTRREELSFPKSGSQPHGSSRRESPERLAA